MNRHSWSRYTRANTVCVPYMNKVDNSLSLLMPLVDC